MYGIAGNGYAVLKTKKRRYFDYSGWKLILFENHVFLAVYETTVLWREYLNWPVKSSADWCSFCCKVTDALFSNQESTDREGFEVEIDESFIV